MKKSIVVLGGLVLVIAFMSMSACAPKVPVQSQEQEVKDENPTPIVLEAPTYYPELSCSHLPSCQVSVVPSGYFSIGFKAKDNGCNWTQYLAGEEIPYAEIDEFHTYLGTLPHTKLTGFVESQFQYVNACQSN